MLSMVSFCVALISSEDLKLSPGQFAASSLAEFEPSLLLLEFVDANGAFSSWRGWCAGFSGLLLLDLLCVVLILILNGNKLGRAC